MYLSSLDNSLNCKNELFQKLISENILFQRVYKNKVLLQSRCKKIGPYEFVEFRFENGPVTIKLIGNSVEEIYYFIALDSVCGTTK